MLSSKILLLISSLCFSMILLRWEREDQPSIKSLETQLTNLQRQLQGFDSLKNDLIRHEIAIGWDNQHLSELKDRRAELSSSLAHMSEAFKRGASNMKGSNQEMARALEALHSHHVKLREEDMITINHLEEESVNAHARAKREHEEMIALKDILGEMEQLLDAQKSSTVSREGLRGPRSTNQ